LSNRQVVALLAVIIAMSTTIGFLLASLASPSNADAARAHSASDAAITRELRDINRALGATYKSNSLLGLADDIKAAIGKSCRALAEQSYACPSSF
jgi:hypothetical protein